MTNSYSAWCTHNQQHCPHLCTEKNSKATTDHRSSDSQLIGTYLPSLSTLSADGKCHSMYLRFHEKQLENCFSVRRTATEFQVNGTASGSKSGHTQTMAGLLGEHWRASALGNRHIDKGIYYDQLLRWLYNFGVQTGQSRSDFQKNIHIIFTDDLKSKPQFVMQELLQFLYANGTIPDALTEVNQSWKKILEKPNSLSSRNSLSHQQKLELYKYFYRYNNFLKEVFECPYETSGNLYDNGHSTLCGRLFRMINQWNHNIQEKTEENSYQQSSNQ